MNEEKNKEKETGQESFFNPIDKDKIAENPHLLPYAHTVGGAVIKPIDKGRTKGLALDAMYEQSDMQLDQIRDQVALLVQQAENIRRRVDISEKIYKAEMGFKPIISKNYHLYERKSSSKSTKSNWILSLVGPDEWGRSCPYDFLATVKLLSDHTWDILDGDLTDY